LSSKSAFEWNKRFKKDESLYKTWEEGRASTSRIEESIEGVQMCLTEDRTFSVRMLEEMTRINTETVREVSVEC
jgi:hypothetical protein